MPGAVTTVELKLGPGPVASPTRPALGNGVGTPSNEQWSYSKWIVVGSGATLTLIAGTIGTVYALRAGSKQSDVERLRGQAQAQLGGNCASDSNETVCRDLNRATSQRNTANSVETMAFIATGVLAAGTIATAIFWQQSQPSAHARIIPTFDQTGAALTVQGVF